MLFNLILYFLTNLKREPGAFFVFLLFTYTSVLLMAALFRFVAAISKHEATAVSIAGVLLLALVIYTGCKLTLPIICQWSEEPDLQIQMSSRGHRCIRGSNGYRTSIQLHTRLKHSW